ncbi:MAG: ABC transporter permease [Planctomycetaceae bacterium]|nr:ABC transporter permease [Planctomycetaceae bacterium]
MVAGTLTLALRALLVDARDIKSHLFRAALPALFLLTIGILQWNDRLTTAPGLQLFGWLATYNYIFLTMAGATFFATAIAEEYEERTLGLLVIAGMNRPSILSGKWLPRMWTAVLLLLVQLPFTLMCVTLGGVRWVQIIAIFVALVAHLFMVGALGLLCSVLCRTSSQAASVATVVLVLLHAGFYLSMRSAVTFPVWYEFLAYFRLTNILSSGFSESPVSLHVIVNLTVGIVLLALAWALFDPSRETDVQTRRASIRHLLGMTRASQSRRAWSSAPLVWQGFTQVAGGWRAIFARCLIHTAGPIVLYYSIFKSGLSATFGGFVEQLGVAMLVWSIWGIAIEGAILGSQSFRSELKEQTWGTLCQLPRTVGSIAHARLAGMLIAMLPVLICLLMGAAFSVGEWSRNLSDDTFWVLSTLAVGLIIWGWYLSAFFSVTVDWAAWPIAILFTSMTLGIYVTFTFMLAPSPSLWGKSVVTVNGLLAMGLAGILHLWIGRMLVRRAAD